MVLLVKCVCVCVCVCKQLPGNQSFDKLISSHQNGGGVSRWGNWVGKAIAYKFDTCTLIGVHSTMHLVDPIKVHVSYTCVCACVCVCVCVLSMKITVYLSHPQVVLILLETWVLLDSHLHIKMWR